MIEVKNICKSYGLSQVVQDVSFVAKRGEVLGFLGSNGAGKTTTLRILSTYMLPTEGTATIGGYDILKDGAKIRKILGYLPENPPLYSDMTVLEYLDFVATIKGEYRKKIRHDKVCDVVTSCFLGDVTGKLCKTLSKGYKQRVGIAAAIVNDPEVVILDEPTSGLDPRQIVQIRELIKRLGETKTVLLSTHLLQEVQAVCDKVVIIANGKVTFDGEIKEYTKDDLEVVVMDKLSGNGDLMTE